MIVRSAGNDLNVPCLQSLAERLRIIRHILHINLEVIGQRLLKAHGFCRDHMHQRSALEQVAEAISIVIKEGEAGIGKAQAIIKTLTDKYPLV